MAEAFVPHARDTSPVHGAAASIRGSEIVAPSALAIALGAQSHRRPVSLRCRLRGRPALQRPGPQLPVAAILLHLQAVRRVFQPHHVAISVLADTSDHVHAVPLQLPSRLHVVGGANGGLGPRAHAAGTLERPRQVLQGVPALAGGVGPGRAQWAHRGLPGDLGRGVHAQRAAGGVAQGESVGCHGVHVEHHAVELGGGLHAVEDHGVVEGEAVGGDSDCHCVPGSDALHGLRVVSGVRHAGGGAVVSVGTSSHHNHPHAVILCRIDNHIIHIHIPLRHLRLGHEGRHTRVPGGRQIGGHRGDDPSEGLQTHRLAASLSGIRQGEPVLARHVQPAARQMHLLHLPSPHRRGLRQEQPTGPSTHDGHRQELGSTTRNGPPSSVVIWPEANRVVAVEWHGCARKLHGDLELFLVHTGEMVVPGRPVVRDGKMGIGVQLAVVMGAVHDLKLPTALDLGAFLTVDPLGRPGHQQIDLAEGGYLGDGLVAHRPREPRGGDVNDGARHLLPTGLATALTRAIADLVLLRNLVLHNGD
mmetsp:Transcript_1544/g.3144  ORF Transcript_1544/g.3144 Transcript_1544/m.3144 type:complete len:531 (-) Transcript_1544:27-1619(-)